MSYIRMYLYVIFKYRRHFFFTLLAVNVCTLYKTSAAGWTHGKSLRFNIQSPPLSQRKKGHIAVKIEAEDQYSSFV